MLERRFTKVKWNGTKVVLLYEQTRQEGEPDEFSLSCGDRPTREFIEAFDAPRRTSSRSASCPPIRRRRCR